MNTTEVKAEQLKLELKKTPNLKPLKSKKYDLKKKVGMYSKHLNLL